MAGTRLPDLGGGSVMHGGWLPGFIQSGGWAAQFGLSWGGNLGGGGFAGTPPINPIGNAPPPRTPDTWGPAPASGVGGPVNLFLHHTGPRNPRGRPRKRAAADYSTFAECVGADPTDTGVEACAEAWGLPEESSTIPFPGVDFPVIGFPVAAALRAVAGFPIAAALLWPTAAGKGSDLRGVYALPAPAASPGRRPGRRPRRVPPPGFGTRPTSVRPPAKPVARPSSGPVTISKPTIQAPAQVRTAEVQAPRPSVLTSPVQIQVGDITAAVPGEATNASSTAAAGPSVAAPSILSTVGQWATNALPFLPLALPFAAASLSPLSAPSTFPLTALQPNAVTSPATAALPQSDSCSKARTRDRKRKRKKPCKNPTVSSRLETKGGKRYQIIKRWLKCPASSRKKHPSPLAR